MLSRLKSLLQFHTCLKLISLQPSRLCGANFFAKIFKAKNRGGELDLMGDVIPYLIKQKQKVYGYVTDAYWYDVGSIEAYEKLSPDVVEDMFSFIF